MPTYDGIGSSITHNVEVDGNLFLQDIEGGPDSTRVPLEIFSNLVSSSVESANSRMLRLRVQNYGETNTDNSYVTDMGIRGDPGKDYFFITAPQNTSNVGDQNTFVISTTSNVGIGTTDPGHYRLLVNNSSTKHFGVPGNDTPSTGDTLVYNEDGEWVYHFVEGTLPPGTVDNEILTWNGSNWVPNSSIITTNSNTSIGIGTYTPSANLHVIGSVTATTDVDISGKFQGGKLRVGSLLSAVPTNPNVTVPGDLTVSGTLTSDAWIHTSNLDITGNINVDYDVLIDGTYQGTGMRLDGTLQNLRGAIPDLSVAGSITATGDIKTDQTFRGTDASITGTITASNIIGGSPLTISTGGSNVQILNSNVGIGTASPGTNLHIVNTADITTSAEVLRLQRGDGTGDIQSNTRGTIGMYLRDSNLGGGEVARISWGHDGGDADPEGKGRLGFWTSDTSGAEGVPVERMTIRASGRVGIATASPSYKLHVWGGDSETTIVGATGTNQGTGVFYVGQSPAYGGGIAYNGDGSPDWDGSGSDYISLFRRENNANSWTARNFYNSNNWEFRGAVSKASGSFKIDHPLPELSNTHNLYHSFIEGPQADLIYRGKIQLVDGHAEINIDTVSNMTEGTFVALNRNTQCFTTNETDWDPVRGSLVGNILTIECQNTSSVATISWMVIGERQDKHMYDTEWTDDNGKVIPEQPKT